jgi:hypothetical protein
VGEHEERSDRENGLVRETGEPGVEGHQTGGEQRYEQAEGGDLDRQQLEDQNEQRGTEQAEQEKGVEAHRRADRTLPARRAARRSAKLPG